MDASVLAPNTERTGLEMRAASAFVNCHCAIAGEFAAEEAIGIGDGRSGASGKRRLDDLTVVVAAHTRKKVSTAAALSPDSYVGTEAANVSTSAGPL